MIMTDVIKQLEIVRYVCAVDQNERICEIYSLIMASKASHFEIYKYEI